MKLSSLKKMYFSVKYQTRLASQVKMHFSKQFSLLDIVLVGVSRHQKTNLRQHQKHHSNISQHREVLPLFLLALQHLISVARPQLKQPKSLSTTTFFVIFLLEKELSPIRPKKNSEISQQVRTYTVFRSTPATRLSLKNLSAYITLLTL